MIQYQAVSQSQQEIRLVSLLPARSFSSDAPPEIKCTISHASLKAPPAYTALSYTWGDPKQTAEIIIDGQPATVTVNLKSALEHLRHDKEPLTVWIDAICINQADIAEKSWQVEQMLSIYRAAKQVIVWLGPASDGSDLAMDKLWELGKTICAGDWLKDANSYKYVMSVNNERMNLICEHYFAPAFEAFYESIERNKVWVIPTISSLLRRPWWARIWVIQELAAAGRVTFACGTRRIGERELYLALGTMYGFAHCLETGKIATPESDLLLTFDRRQWHAWERDSRPIVQLRCREICRNVRAGVENPFNNPGEGANMLTLKTLLRLTCRSSTGHRMGATDGRDRIFALLGIASDGGGLGIRVDYSTSVSVSDVFSTATKAMVRNGSLSLGEMLSLAQSPKDEKELPSWVPDWSTPIAEPLWEITPQRKNRLSHFTPSHLKQPDISPLLLTTTDPSRITIPTLTLDTIAALAPAFIPSCCEEGSSTSLNQHKTATWLSTIEDLAARSQPSPYGPKLEDALWRCLIADTEKEGAGRLIVAQPELVNAYRALRGGKVQRRSKNRRDAPPYLLLLAEAQTGRRVCVTERGYVGLAVEGAEEGDVVASVPEADLLYVFRVEKEGEEVWRSVGEAYVHGLMRCEGGEEAEAEARWANLKMLEVV